MVHKTRGPYAGKFDLPGGKLEEGETLDEALEREVFEETGCRMLSREQLFTRDTLFTYKKDGEDVKFHHIGIFYTAQLYEESVSVEPKEDAGGTAWVCLEDITPESTALLACEAIFDVLNRET